MQVFSCPVWWRGYGVFAAVLHLVLPSWLHHTGIIPADSFRDSITVVLCPTLGDPTCAPRHAWSIGGTVRFEEAHCMCKTFGDAMLEAFVSGARVATVCSATWTWQYAVIAVCISDRS
jgi:hypothetical protein